MNIRLEALIAIRYFRSRRNESFISISSLFSFLGITIGVATLIIVMSVMNGFRAQLIDKIVGINGHLILYFNDDSYKESDVIEKIETISAHLKQMSSYISCLSAQNTRDPIASQYQDRLSMSEAEFETALALFDTHLLALSDQAFEAF